MRPTSTQKSSGELRAEADLDVSARNSAHWQRQQQQSRRDCESRARAKCGCRSETLVQHTEDHTGEQRANTKRRIVEAECGAALRGWRKVRHECLLASFSQAEIDAVDEKPRHQRCGRC